MPHSRLDWAGRIKDTEREYRAVRIGLDWLIDATPDEAHDLAEARGWDDLATTDAYEADARLDATYLIRMYSVFERAVASFWRLEPGNADREADGRALIEEVGDLRQIPEGSTRGAQAVRAHRNRLVHGRLDLHASALAFEDARAQLLTYFQGLPETWG